MAYVKQVHKAKSVFALLPQRQFPKML